MNMNSTIAAVAMHSPIPVAQHNPKATRSNSGQLLTESRLPADLRSLERIVPAGGVNARGALIGAADPARPQALML
jgi:hypothetical protein